MLLEGNSNYTCFHYNSQSRSITVQFRNSPATPHNFPSCSLDLYSFIYLFQSCRTNRKPFAQLVGEQINYFFPQGSNYTVSITGVLFFFIYYSRGIPLGDDRFHLCLVPAALPPWDDTPRMRLPTGRKRDQVNAGHAASGLCHLIRVTFTPTHSIACLKIYVVP